MADIIDLIEEGKIKRYLRARNKLCFENAIAHITQHATGKEELFVEDADYLYMLHTMKEMASAHGFNMLSFVLMPKHIHLLIKLAKQNLAEAMKELFERYAKFFNKKYERKGHVFCGAYRSALCMDESYALSSSVYIHLNPVRAGLVENPADYRWSSCNLFLAMCDKDTFVDYRFILQLLDTDMGRAIEKYKNLLVTMLARKNHDILENSRAMEDFRQHLLYVLKDAGANFNTLTSMELERKIMELKEKKRLRNPHEAQAWKFLVEQLMARGYTISDIARKLNVHRSSVYNILHLANSTNSAMHKVSS